MGGNRVCEEYFVWSVLVMSSRNAGERELFESSTLTLLISKMSKMFLNLLRTLSLDVALAVNPYLSN